MLHEQFINFANNIENQSKLDAELTYRDARYYDCFVRRSSALPMNAAYNHEPIYGRKAEVEYNDGDFEKYLYWCAIRGAALNELYLSPDMMNEFKWSSLAKVMTFQKENFEILKNASFIGGDPEGSNIYGFISFTEDGEGIVALRNPSDEITPLTLTFNKLMGVNESFENRKCEVVFASTEIDTDREFSYNDKLDISMNTFETVILKFTK